MTLGLTRVQSAPGVQRDGTILAAQAYTDAQWCRWQRGLPRKMGGYKNTQAYLTAVSRALYSQSGNSPSYGSGSYRFISSGTAYGVDQFTIDTTGVPSGVLSPTFPPTTNPTTTGLPTGSINSLPFSQVNSWQFDTQYDNLTNSTLLFMHAAQNLIDPSNSGNFPLYCMPVYSPGGVSASFIASVSGNTLTVSNVVGTIAIGQTVFIPGGVATAIITAGAGTTWTLSNTYGSIGPLLAASTNVTQVSGYATGTIPGFSAGPPANNVYQALFPNGFSGGICSLAPYMTVFGNDGFIAWSAPGYPTDFTGFSQGSLYVGATRVTNKKLIRGLPLRGGGGYSPSGLYWSIDSVVRANFVGTSNGTFQFDQLTTESSILSDRCVIEHDGIFYWAGFDRFLMYNGVIQEIQNTMNLNWFFDNINQTYAGKSFAFKLPRYGEIWWCYPRGTNTECSHAVIYNYREKVWYDTALPTDYRSSALHADNFIGVIACSPTTTANQTYALTAVANSSSGQAVYTGAVPNGAGNGLYGQSFVVSGFVNAVNNGTFVCQASTSTTITLNNIFASAETNPATIAVASNYNLWRHEQGVDESLGSTLIAIPSYFTTSYMTSFDANPPNDNGISLGDMQPDFIQSGNITVTVLKKNNAASPEYQGTVATIQASPLSNATLQQQLIGYTVQLKDTAKMLRLQFASNVVGGNYQMGRTMIEIQSDGDRDT